MIHTRNQFQIVLIEKNKNQLEKKFHGIVVHQITPKFYMHVPFCIFPIRLICPELLA